MNMIYRIVTLLIGNFFTIYFSFFCWYRLLNKKTNNKWFNILLVDVIITIIDILLNHQTKIIVVCISLAIINKILVSKDTKKSIILVSFSQTILGLSEFIVAILLSFIYKEKVSQITNNNGAFIVVSIIITVISLIIFQTIIFSKNYKENIEKKVSNKNNSLLFYTISLIAFMIITTAESYNNVSITVVLITNTIVTIFFIYIIVKIAIIDSKYDKVNSKYQTSINSLKEYETMIDKFRVNTHENKNELLTIRNMVKNNEKKIVEYIDTLVDNKIKDNEKIMYQTSKIPEGGLRATIYSKLCVMDKHKIKYRLEISKDVRTVDLINLDEELILNICKILSVFMDNAIEAVKSLKKKEIDIELYVVNNELYIDITNNYKGNIDLSKIGREKQTTKGKEHGYGLLLVNKIVNENSKKLTNENNISGNYFTQTLIIKI
ncbi:MAG: GHKL domain-containing protein [Bacilli bacterium]|nr:GHKL domain-containing protein [Bacilli bacterium]